MIAKAGLTLPGAPRLQGVVGPPSHPGGGVRCDASVTPDRTDDRPGGGGCDASVTRTGPTTDRGVRCDASVTRTGPTTDRGGGGGCDAMRA